MCGRDDERVQDEGGITPRIDSGSFPVYEGDRQVEGRNKEAPWNMVFEDDIVISSEGFE